MKKCSSYRPIVLKTKKEINAAEKAISRSLKNGKASKMLKEACSKPPIVKVKS